MKTFLRLALAVFLMAALTRTQAQDFDSIRKVEQDLVTQKERFKDAVEKQKKIALAAFDREINAVKSSQAKAGVRVEVIDRYQKAKDRFAADGTWPDGDDFLKVHLDFAMGVQRAYGPLSNSYNKLIDLCLKAKNVDAAKVYQKAKAEFDDQLPGRKNVHKGARYGGTKFSSVSKTVVPIKLVITSEDDSTFTARFESNMSKPGHLIFEFKGTIDGIQVTMQPSKAIQGHLPTSAFVGYVTGDKILVSKPYTSSKGKSSMDYYMFTK